MIFIWLGIILIVFVTTVFSLCKVSGQISRLEEEQEDLYNEVYNETFKKEK